MAILELSTVPPRAVRSEQRVPGGLEIAQAAAAALHQTPRCSLPGSPLRQMGHTPKALWQASQSNPIMQVGVLLLASSSCSMGLLPECSWGVVQAHASRDSGFPAHSWHHAMPSCASEGVRHDHLGEVAPQA